MYMRVVRARIDPAKVDEAISQVGQDLAAAVKRGIVGRSARPSRDRAMRSTASPLTVVLRYPG